MMPVRARWTTEEVFDYMIKQLRIEQESKILLEGATSSSKDMKMRHDGWQREVKKVEFKEKPSMPLTCWTCRAAGRPHDHFWRTCKLRLEDSFKKGSNDGLKVNMDVAKTMFGKGGKGKGGKGKGGKGGRGWSQ